MSHGERGIGMTEALLAMTILAALGLLAVRWIATGFASDDLHASDDRAIAELESVKQLLTRDIREAKQVLAGDALTMTLWLDADADELVGDTEQVVWTVSGSTVTRTQGSAGVPRVEGTGISAADTAFTYDAPVAQDVRSVSVTLAISVEGQDPGWVHTVSTSVRLRNR